MIDSHAHLHDQKFDKDRQEVIKRILEGEIENVINIGTSLKESRDAVSLANKYENMYASVGIHPTSFKKDAQNEFDVYLGSDLPVVVRKERLKNIIKDLEELIVNNSKVVAVGEIGIDYFNRDGREIQKDERAWQLKAFSYQIELARDNGLPVVIHTREGNENVSYSAYDDCLEIIKDFPEVSFVLHCYMGNAQQTEKFLELENVIFSFAGNITYNKKPEDEMNKVIKLIPLTKILVETDSPYLTPIPHRGERNEPIFVEYVVEHIAKTKDISIKKVKEVTRSNTKNFFKIGKICAKCAKVI